MNQEHAVLHYQCKFEERVQIFSFFFSKFQDKYQIISSSSCSENRTGKKKFLQQFNYACTSLDLYNQKKKKGKRRKHHFLDQHQCLSTSIYLFLLLVNWYLNGTLNIISEKKETSDRISRQIRNSILFVGKTCCSS